MAIKIHDNIKSSVDNFMMESLSILEEEVTRALSYLGEQSIRLARDRDAESSWFDHTGNLRSSIGYSLYVHGQEKMTSSFKRVLKGSEGATIGRKLAQELASQHKNDFSLVLIAGMNYASHVENIKGKDVLASTQLFAEGKVDEYIDKAVERASKRIQKLKI